MGSARDRLKAAREAEKNKAPGSVAEGAARDRLKAAREKVEKETALGVVTPALPQSLNTAQERSGLSRDKFDSSVRSAYAQRMQAGQDENVQQPRDASLYDLTIGSVKRGYDNSLYGREAYKAMTGQENRMEEYAEKMAGEEYNFEPSNWLEKGLSGAAELLGQQFRQWTDLTSLALAGTGAGMAAIAGQAGPQVLLPEEIVTVPAAAITGLQLGSAKANMEIEAGHAYLELKENGVSEDAAKLIASGVGGANALLELVQMDELAKSFKVLDKIGADEGILKAITKELAERGVDVAKETAQEVAQEGVTIAGTQIGSKMESGEWAYNAEDVLGRLGDTALSSALSFGVMNVPAGVSNAYQKIKGRKAVQEPAGADLEEDKGIAQTAPAETVGWDNEVLDVDDVLRKAAEEMATAETSAAPLVDTVSRDNDVLDADKMLTEGFTTVEGNSFEPNQEYIAAKAKIPGYVETVRGELPIWDIEIPEDSDVEQRAVQSAYEAGRANVPLDKVNLMDSAQEEAYMAGRKDYIDAMPKEQTKGVMRDDYVAKMDQNVVKTLDTVAKSLGVKVQFVESVAGGEANAEIQDGVISIERNNPNPVRTLFGHEITHRLQELAPTEYAKLRDAAMADTSFVNEKAAAMQELYAKHGVDLSSEKAVDELTADYVGRMMEDSGFMERFIETHRSDHTFLDKLRDVFRELVRKLTGHYRTLAGKAEKRLTEAMEAATKAVENQTNQGYTGVNETRYSLKEDIESGKAREESRESFNKRGADGAGEGYAVFEGETAAYGYRTVRGVPSPAAQQVFEEIKALGGNCVIIDGDVEWNQNGYTRIRQVQQASTVEGKLILINNAGDMEPRNVAGHEVFHSWKNRAARQEYVETLVDNILFTSPEFLHYQSTVAEGYFGEEVDLTDGTKVTKLTEEIHAYISGDIHEGANDDQLRPMFRDYDAVKAAWKKLAGGKTSYSLKGSEQLGREIERIMRDGKRHKRSDAEIQADIRAAVDEVYQGMIVDYGAIEPGERPSRDVQVPRKTSDDKKVSQTVRTVMESEVTPDDFIPLLEQKTAMGGFSFVPITNDESVQNAQKYIMDRGWTGALTDWTADVRKGKAGDQITAIGALLYNNAVNSGNYRVALDILADYQMAVRSSARGLQAARILKTLTPESRLYMIRKSIQSMVDAMKLPEDIELPQELVDTYMAAATDAEIDRAVTEIQQYVADQIPSTGIDMWTALRYTNMLGNFKTQVRNIFGNMGMRFLGDAENAVATALELFAGKKTRSLVVGKKLKQLAKADFQNVRGEALSESKYTLGNETASAFASGVADKKTVFKRDISLFGKDITLPKVTQPVFSTLEGYRKVTNWAMNNQYFGDEAFTASAYAHALAGYLKANGVTAEQFADAKWQSKNAVFVDEARQSAIKRAQELTFRDQNTLSNWVSSLGRKNSTPRAVKAISEGVLPFRRTPANVLIRAEEYSPLGFVNATVQAIRAARGTATGTDVINSLAKSLTGTGIFVLGMALKNAGWLRGGDDEDDQKAAFDDLTGHQAYALELPDGTSITLDWLTPAAMPLFMGVQLEVLRQDGDIELKDLEKALTSIADPMLQMSMLQGLNDTLADLRYSQDANLGQLAATAALGYLTQGLTNSLVGQATRTSKDVSTMTYVDKDSAVPAWVQRELGAASRKTPKWDYNQIPYIDAWGRTESTGEIRERAFNNFFNPAYTSTIEVSKMEEEILRLYEATGESSVIPDRADKYFAVNNQRKDLTSEEYVKYAAKKGQTAYNLASKLTANKQYQSLSDSEKVDAVAMVYEYANQTAKASIDKGVKVDKWVKNAKEAQKNYGVSADTFILLRVKTADINGWYYSQKVDKNGNPVSIQNSAGMQIMDAVYKTGATSKLTDSQRKALFIGLGVGDSVAHFNKTLVGEKLAVMKKQAK